MKRTSWPRALRALATASPTRTSRKLPTWMCPEVLIPVTTTCGPSPKESATFFAQPGTSFTWFSTSTYKTLLRGRGALAGDLDVHDLVLSRAAGRRDRDLIPNPPLEDCAADGRGVGELAVRRVGLVGPDDLEGPLVLLAPFAS